MNCDHVQEILSAFLDHEESAEEMEKALSHLYGCKACQQFFNAGAMVRNAAKEEKANYPVDLDERIFDLVHRRSPANVFNYRLKLPAYAVTAAAVILMAVSFTFGFMAQENVHQKEMNAILQAPPSEVVYGIPARIVYPEVNHQSKGGIR